MTWYGKITQDLSHIPDFITHYENELISAKNDVKVYVLNIQLRKLKRKYFKKYLENYNRQLTPRDAEKYAEGEDDVIDFEVLINEVALLRNKWLGILKGIDAKQWQLGHIVRLRTAGMEDVTIG